MSIQYYSGFVSTSDVTYRTITSVYQFDAIPSEVGGGGGVGAYAIPFTQPVSFAGGFGYRKFTKKEDILKIMGLDTTMDISKLSDGQKQTYAFWNSCQGHLAIDIGCGGYGAVLCSPETGMALQVPAGDKLPGGNGNATNPGGEYPCVHIIGDSGNHHYFGHMDGTKYLKGQTKVNAGDKICEIARGVGVGPHLHWVFCKKDAPQIPVDAFVNFIQDPEVQKYDPKFAELAKNLLPAYQQYKLPETREGCIKAFG